MKIQTDLINRARSGDIHAFSMLYETIYQDLYRFALYTLKNSHDAEDAVSDAVTDAFRQIQSLRQAEAFGSWMFRILTCKCRQKLKSYTEKLISLSDDSQWEEPSSSSDIDEQIAVRQAFFHLDDEERLILSLHLFAGYSSKEISTLLHMNDNTVRSKQSRALKKMQDSLS